MKRILLIVSLFGGQLLGFSQEDTASRFFPEELLSAVDKSLPPSAAPELLTMVKTKLTTDPDLYNRAWSKILSLSPDNKLLSFFRDLDVAFKTFEVQDADAIGLGFQYDWHFDRQQFYASALKRKGYSFQFYSNGNVAFRKALNPYDFLTHGVSFGGFQYSGGVVDKSSSEVFDLLNDLELSLVEMTTTEEIENSAEWKSFNENLELTDQFYIGFDGVVQLENTQDFTQKQWVAGARLGLGAKGWSQHSTLAYFNLLDYPFAFLRLITGTDKTFRPDGATIPVFMTRVDYVKPVNDRLRKEFTGTEDSYARINMELGFRTLISEWKDHSIFFNADWRYFREINPPDIIKEAKLHRHVYFAASLSSSKGFFAGFATGRLPFDAGNDNVYELGFRYRF